MLNQQAWEALKFRRKCQADPVFFVRWVLGVVLWKKQAQVLRDLVDNREVAVKSCHSAGKSFLAACAALWFLWSFPRSLVLTTAPTDRQVRTILWKEINTLYRRARIPLGGRALTKEIHLDSDNFAIGFTAPEWDPDRFQGMHAEHLLFIVDEAAGISPMIYEAIDAITMGAHSRLLMIGNPTDPKGDFCKGFKPERDDVVKHTISAFDTPNFVEFGITIDDIRKGTWKRKVNGRSYPYPHLATPEWASKMWKKAGEGTPIWQARVMGEFPDDDGAGLVPLSWFIAARERWYEREATDNGWTGQASMGLDVARMGNDATVAAIHHEDEGVRQFHKRRKSLTTETAAWVNMLLKEDDSIWSVRVDGDGIGAGVLDMLRDEHGAGRVLEMRGGMTADNPERFVNLRSEWLWNVRERLNPTHPKPWALPDDEDLEFQLTSILWKLTRKGLIQVETKDDMRKRGLNSPDELDAVAYAGANVNGFKPMHVGMDGLIQANDDAHEEW